jgi:hypothetical protein
MLSGPEAEHRAAVHPGFRFHVATILGHRTKNWSGAMVDSSIANFKEQCLIPRLRIYLGATSELQRCIFNYNILGYSKFSIDLPGCANS